MIQAVQSQVKGIKGILTKPSLRLYEQTVGTLLYIQHAIQPISEWGS